MTFDCWHLRLLWVISHKFSGMTEWLLLRVQWVIWGVKQAHKSPGSRSWWRKMSKQRPRMNKISLSRVDSIPMSMQMPTQTLLKRTSKNGPLIEVGLSSQALFKHHRTVKTWWLSIRWVQRSHFKEAYPGQSQLRWDLINQAWGCKTLYQVDISHVNLCLVPVRKISMAKRSIRHSIVQRRNLACQALKTWWLSKIWSKTKATVII